MSNNKLNIMFIVCLITHNISLIMLVVGLIEKNKSLACVGFMFLLMLLVVFAVLDDMNREMRDKHYEEDN